MAYDCAITQKLLRRQQSMFLEASNLGYTQKIIANDADLGRTTVGQYARGETALSGVAILKLKGAFKQDYGTLISMLHDDNLQLVDAPAEMDHHAVNAACLEYSAALSAAQHPDSECGTAVGPNEDANLRIIGGSVAAKAGGA